MTLQLLKNNETATVVRCQIKRLCEMGCVPGERISMVKEGNPCIVRLCNATIGVGLLYQAMIEIEGERP